MYVPYVRPEELTKSYYNSEEFRRIPNSLHSRQIDDGDTIHVQTIIYLEHAPNYSSSGANASFDMPYIIMDNYNIQEMYKQLDTGPIRNIIDYLDSRTYSKSQFSRHDALIWCVLNQLTQQA